MFSYANKENLSNRQDINYWILFDQKAYNVCLVLVWLCA